MKKLLSILLAALLLAAVLAPIPALAADEINGDGFYVIDLCGLLSDPEAQTLASAAETITRTYGCGVHIGVIGDMRDYGFTNIEDCAEEFFNSFGLGVDPDHTGILLLLSMAERDYDIDAHGEFAHYAFTDYGKTTISDVFLDNFRNDDWFGGFFDYLSRCEVMLQLARSGEPVDITASQRAQSRITPAGLLISLVISLLIAWLICSALKGRNKSVRAATNADAYVPAGAVAFRIRDDRFSHQTVTRRRIERSERSGGGGGGGTTVSSGGHSHSSGKF